MLAHGGLRVVHVSTHVSFVEARQLVKKDRVLDVIRIAYDACKDLGISEPREEWLRFGGCLGSLSEESVCYAC